MLRIFTKSFFLLFGAISVGFLGGLNARATQFGDWEVKCDEAVDRTILCQLFASAASKEAEKKVFLLTISKGKNISDSVAVITVPMGVYLANGIELRVDGQRPFKILYEVCGQNGCHAGFKLSNQVLASFKRGNESKFRVWTAKSKAVEFKLSLLGFTKAFEYYQGQVKG